ncbi:MAG: hypothetical protein P1P59_09135 [Treponemataceae bacterium]
MRTLIKKIGKVVATVFSAIAAFLALLFFGKKRKSTKETKNAKAKAQKHKDEVYEKIQKTDASELVNTSDNADELRAITNSIKQDFADTVKNRIEKNGL